MREFSNKPTAQRPLAKVLAQVKTWFDNERSCGTEVRERHIRQRVRYQIEHERDSQVVHQQTGSKHFDERVLNACIEKLQKVSVHSVEKNTKRWFDTTVFPQIGASCRMGQHKSTGSENMDEQKFMVTTKGVDYGLYLVTSGTHDELAPFIQDPQWFIKNRERTWIIFLDETALWLKLRGEEKVMISFEETMQAEKRRALRTLLHKRDQREANEGIEAKIQKFLSDGTSDNSRDMIRQFYHSGGDKHRLTLINVSGIKNWFNPELDPECRKDVCVLLVFCEQHICSEWIDDDHKFKFDVEVPTPTGKVLHKQGETTKLLYSFIEHRKSYEDQDTARRLRVWGQKKSLVRHRDLLPSLQGPRRGVPAPSPDLV